MPAVPVDSAFKTAERAGRACTGKKHELADRGRLSPSIRRTLWPRVLPTSMSLRIGLAEPNRLLAFTPMSSALPGTPHPEQ